MRPGEYLLDHEAGAIQANAGRPTTRLLAKNTGDRPVQVGSHFHFFEVNCRLAFDRASAYGMRLNIAAGTAVRFEPGEEKEIELTDFGGARVIHGFNGLVEGALDRTDVRERALRKAAAFQVDREERGR
jgi:urease subunit beta